MTSDDLTPALVTALSDLLGDRFTSSPGIRADHARSETHYAGHLPGAVAYPVDGREVSEIVSLCAAHATPVIGYGAGTSLEGNAAAVHGGLIVAFTRMDRIVTVNAEDFDCVVEPGVTREQLNAHLRDHGLFFPIDPGANATIGGMLSTRASGTNAVRYGTMREQVLSLSVVLADGREVQTGARARKSAAGYDLTHLIVGSEGTLGLVTQVRLRLHPVPEAIATATCSFGSLDDAVRTVVQTIQMGVPVARAELLDERQMAAVNRWSKTDYPVRDTLFFEFHGSPRYVEEQVETVAALVADNGGSDLAWATGQEERTRLWRARHDAYYAAMALRPGAAGWATDVCVPIGNLAECIRQTKLDLDATAIPATILGHVGDGNFHVVFALDPDSRDERDEVEAINARLIERALRLEGTCTGEHGIGLGKKASLEAELGGAVDAMRAIKRALDPGNIFNPGKIFDSAPVRGHEGTAT